MLSPFNLLLNGNEDIHMFIMYHLINYNIFQISISKVHTFTKLACKLQILQKVNSNLHKNRLR